jgi:citronellol/citronellal dehydrogenase
MLDIEAAKRNPFASQLFAGQVALVTGGGSGIGKACARELLQLGASVVIAGRKPEKLDAAVAELAAEIAPEQAGRVFAMPCDIREPEQIAKLVAAALEQFGRIDVLINNAGGQFPAPASELSTRGFDAVIRNNLSGTFYVTREVAARAMLPAKRGAIVNVTAMVSRGFPGMMHTGAARAGVENMTQTLAVEWAHADVRVNAVAPGIIDTEIHATAGDPHRAKRLAASIPLGRAGTANEVAEAIVWLLSPAASYITGTIVEVGGGR